MTQIPPAPIAPRALARELEEAAPVVIDCRFDLADPGAGRAAFETGHIPGAVHFDLDEDLAGPAGAGGRHPLPDLAALAGKLAATGIDSDPPTPVVLYDDSRCAFAARLWWLLRYLGHDDVRLLDGGFRAWREAGLPVTTDVGVRGAGNFTARPRPSLVADIETVRAASAQRSALLVDAREAARYRGEVEPIDPVAGHIPGACNAPWTDATDDAGCLRDTGLQRRRWQDFGEEPVIVYCGSGVTACVDVWSLAVAGINDAKLYVGSFSQWCRDSDNPVATGQDPV